MFVSRFRGHCPLFESGGLVLKWGITNKIETWKPDGLCSRTIVYTTHAGHYMRRTDAFYTLYSNNGYSVGAKVFILVACVKMFMPRFTLCCRWLWLHPYDVNPHIYIKSAVNISQPHKKPGKVKVSDVSPSVRHQCPVEDMWPWLCEPRGSSQTEPRVAAASQGPNSGALLRPPHWETNPRRSVGTSCLTGPWPCGARPLSGSRTVLWPTYRLMAGWQSCSSIWSSVNFAFREQFRRMQC